MATVLITAGGTSERIDKVRKITNSSTGALGAMIADQLFIQHGDEIETLYYVCSRKAVIPRMGDKKVVVVEIEDVAELEAAIREIMGKTKIDFVIHSMAVSDYTTNYVTNSERLAQELADYVMAHTDVAGEDLIAAFQQLIRNHQGLDRTNKISSQADDLMIGMKPTTKVIGLIKALQPHTFLVGFKLLESVTKERLFDVGFNLLRHNRCNLVLANDLADIRAGEHVGMLIYPEKRHELLHGKHEIAKVLVEVMWKRAASRHPQSHQVGETFELPEAVYQSFHKTGTRLFAAGLLPTVDGGTYGNMSMRGPNGFYMTGRNVNKGDLGRDELTYVEQIDYLDDPQVYARVHYHGKVKPSIDSAINALIYWYTPYHAAVHIHTDRVFAGHPLTTFNYPCGTEMEGESIRDVLKNDHQTDIIQLMKHGLIVLGNTLEECQEKVARLFEEEVSVRPFRTGMDDAAFAEWKAHYGEVDGSGLDVDNPERYEVIMKGHETVGLLYTEQTKSAITFVIYTLADYQRKGYGLGRKVLAILTTRAEIAGAECLTLLTKDECSVKDYYTKVLFFREDGNQGNLIRLSRLV